MKAYILIFYIFSVSLWGDYIVFVHGFLGGPWSLEWMANRFVDEGWEVNNWGYASREKWIEDHAADLVDELNRMQRKHPEYSFHFITHSMGGLVLRAAMNHPKCPEIAKWGKAVLLAPPNQGACWARFLKNLPLTKRIAKRRAGKELMQERIFDYLGEFPESLRVLVIAGNGGINPMLGGENDGTVAVRETYLSTPHEHAVIKAGHKSIVISKKALRLAQAFLE